LVASSENTLNQAVVNFDQSQKNQTIIIKKAENTEENLIDAEVNRAAIQKREATARAEMAEAEGSVSTLRAEVTTLERMLKRETDEQGRLLDKIRVSDGYETALGAALSDDLSLPEVKEFGLSGWFSLPAYKSGKPLPKGVKSLNEFVKVPDVLFRRISQIGLVDQTDGHRLQQHLEPGQRLISIEGDLWRWDGYAARAEDAPGSAALKLKQINRLALLKQDLEESNALAEGTKRAHELLYKELSLATEADRAARDERRQADNELTENNRFLSRSESDRDIASGQLENWKLALSRLEEAAANSKNEIKEADKSLKQLDNLEAARSEIEELKISVETARLTMLTKRSSHDEIRREGENRNKRVIEITQELNNWRQRLIKAKERINELIIRKKETEEELKIAKNSPAEILKKSGLLSQEMEVANKRCKEATNILANSENDLREIEVIERKAERFASEAREARARADAIAEGAQSTLDLARDRIMEEQELTPQNLLEKLDVNPTNLPEAEKVDIDVQRLKRQRDALGAVNLRAEEDANEVKTEFDNLNNESSDLREAISKLRNGISNLNSEGRERLVSAFDQVNKNFGVLFKHLFGGGEASLVLVESDDPLEAGLEIMCQPPGKKLSTLSLLSGGEQTLTALSLIFAVFLANPSPICVLDEVDAPLDDANVTRFCDLLDEMTRRTDTRFLIITHHAVTMARMDRLFGVTMAEPGVSQLVSVDLQKAEKLVA
jgi:chromosome segregation protein